MCAHVAQHCGGKIQVADISARGAFVRVECASISLDFAGVRVIARVISARGAFARVVCASISLDFAGARVVARVIFGVPVIARVIFLYFFVNFYYLLNKNYRRSAAADPNLQAASNAFTDPAYWLRAASKAPFYFRRLCGGARNCASNFSGRP